MANKYRKKQVKVPYRRFKGYGEEPAENELGELVYLGYTRKKTAPSSGFTTPALPFRLPLEVLHIIASFLDYRDLYQLIFVSKMWHVAALPALYRTPKLSPKNFGNFVEILNTRKDLSEMVRDLDLSRTIQVGRNSWTAKILRRCSPGLLRFVASQSHFGFSPLMALRTCTQLRILDLAYVSETVDLPELFNAIQGFHDLEVIRFPRCSVLCEVYDFEWPKNLTTLALAGGISADFLSNIPFPAHIKNLEFNHCPFITTRSLLCTLAKIGPQLTSLTIQYPLPLLTPNAADTILLLCPNLKRLNVSIEYATSVMLDEDMATNHPLSNLSIYSSGLLGNSDKFRPEDIVFSLEYLKSLNNVTLSILLGWNTKTDEMVEELAAQLDERGGGLYLI